MKKFLVIRYKKSVGDTIIGTTLCEDLKKKYPDSEVHYLVYENLTELFLNHKYIDKVLTLDRKKGAKDYMRLLGDIRREKYDAVVDCRSIPLTLYLTLLSGAKIKIGKYKKYRHFFYTHAIKGMNEKMNQIKKYHMMLKPLGVETVTTEYHAYLTDEEKKEWKEKMEKTGIDFSKLIVPMAVNARQTYKKYPEEYMEKIIRFLINEYDSQIILTYSPAEEEDTKKLYNQLSDINKNIFITLKTKNVRELACIFSNCDLFVGNEGGTRHVAEAAGLANFAIVSPDTDKTEWLSNENERNQCIDVKEVNGKEYVDIKPEFVIERIKKQLKAFNYFDKNIKN